MFAVVYFTQFSNSAPARENGKEICMAKNQNKFVFGDEPSVRNLAPPGTYDVLAFPINEEEVRKRVVVPARRECAEIIKRNRGAPIDRETRMRIFAQHIHFQFGDHLPRDEEKQIWSLTGRIEAKIRFPQRSFKFRPSKKLLFPEPPKTSE